MGHVLVVDEKGVLRLSLGQAAQHRLKLHAEAAVGLFRGGGNGVGHKVGGQVGRGGEGLPRFSPAAP